MNSYKSVRVFKMNRLCGWLTDSIGSRCQTVLLPLCMNASGLCLSPRRGLCALYGSDCMLMSIFMCPHKLRHQDAFELYIYIYYAKKQFDFSHTLKTSPDYKHMHHICDPVSVYTVCFVYVIYDGILYIFVCAIICTFMFSLFDVC